MISYHCPNEACPNHGLTFIWDNAQDPHCNACNAKMLGVPVATVRKVAGK